jgi:hypothetical protein
LSWAPVPGGTVADHWIDLQTEDGLYKAVVKWDGCIHFNRYYLYDPEPDYLHICDLDEFIQQLQELRDAALLHFGTPWPR